MHLLNAATLCLALGLGSTIAHPLAAQSEAPVENDLIKVFAGQWVQSKDPAQNGVLMFLTQDRALVGEYFSIRCDGADRSVRIGFPKRMRGKDIGLTLDGVETRYAVDFTGKTKDHSLLKGNVFSYQVAFTDAATREAFLETLRKGRELTIQGQDKPVSLTGAGDAIKEQAGYCK